jgi:sugar lactone lactonase YvrE
LLAVAGCGAAEPERRRDTEHVAETSQALTDPALPAIDFTLQSVIGQPNATEAMTGRIVPYAGFNIGGTHIDRSSSPVKIYMADTGNNRILAFNGYKPQGTNADVVLGQPSGYERGAPNGDMAVRRLPTASTLAFFHQPVNSPTEMPSGAHLDTDASGNLFVPDPSNNRVLKYNNPFTDSTPGQADDVWGQTSFTSLTTGLGDSKFNLELGFWVKAVGLDIDGQGNLWVADIGNHRVMAFPKSGGVIAKQAAWCLGQPNCNSANSNVINRPVSVQVSDDASTVYVLEGSATNDLAGDGKVLKFTGSMASGYSLAATWFAPSDAGGTTLRNPRAMTLDGTTLWIGDTQNERVLKVSATTGTVDGQFTRLEPGVGVTFPGNVSYVNTRMNLGSFGVDSNDILFGWHTRGAGYGTPDYFPGLPRVSKTLPSTGNPQANYLTLSPGDNEIPADGSALSSLHGMVHAGYQMFQSDNLEIKVYNDVQYQNGLVAPSFTLGKVSTFPRSILVAAGGYLFVSGGWVINVYQLPITQNYQAPVKVLTSGANVTWIDDGSPVSFDQIALGTGLAYDPANDALWVTDHPRHRVLRIKNPLGNAVVDMVLGQTSKTAVSENGGAAQGAVSKSGFDALFTLNLDKFGNLYVVDGSFEGGGNKRVLRFDAGKLVPPAGIFFNPALEADAVFAKRSWIVQQSAPVLDHRPNFPVNVVFDRDNHMYLLVDAYGDIPGQADLAQVDNAAYERIYFYERPHLGKDTIEPDRVIKIPFGQAAFGNFVLGDPARFIVQDHTWPRVIQAQLIGVPNTGAPFQQDPGADGLVSMEAEHHSGRGIPGDHDWLPSAQTGASGDGAVAALPNNGANNNTGYATTSPRLDFKVNFVKTGTHYIWARGMGPTGSDDSYHAGLDGQALATCDRIGSFTTSWTWRKADLDGGQANFNVATTGEHTVNVWMREDGFVIDKIVLTTNPSYTPTGTGPVESSRPPAPPQSQKLAVSLVSASTWQDPNVPANTLDGSLATRWSAEGDGQWIVFDLGGPKVIDKVKAAFYNGNARQTFFDVHLSSDGALYHPVLVGVASSGSTLNLEDFDFPEAEARYVRITGHGNSVNAWNSYTEVEVWGTPLTAELGATVSGYSSYQAPNAPGNTLDGNLGTRWSADGVGQWISFDLGATRTVEYLKMAFYQGDTRRALFDVDVSTNGTTWTRVFANGTSSGLNTGLETFNLDDATARYVKITGRGNTVNTWNSYTEVEVWGR